MSSSGTSIASSLPSSDDNRIVQSWQSSSIHQNKQTFKTIPELLQMRQTFGIASPGHNYLTRSVGRPPRISTPYLASRTAWNTRRLQNTILVVGPGTPASVVTAASNNNRNKRNERRHSQDTSNSESGQPAGGNNDFDVTEEIDSNDEDVLMDNNEESDEDDEEESSRDSGRRRRAAFVRRHAQSSDSDDDSDADVSMDNEEYEFLAGSDHDEDNDDDEDDSEDSEEGLSFRSRYLGRRFGRDPPMNTQTQQPHYCPSMRHGGCINTAAWLDAGWSLSTVDENNPMSSAVPVHGVATTECPTQLVTSGDDHLIKFWDVKDAMGMTSPLSGGRSTICPFSASESRNPHDLEEEWQEFYESRQSCIPSNSTGQTKVSPCNDYHLPGNVRLLSTLHTGHRGNVFHVTPLAGRPGVVATCGADGFLRLTDIETGDSTVVVSPEFEDELGGLLPVGLLSLRSVMCYSHHFLNKNVGLLCSERGLKRFDLRLSPREQSTQKLIGGALFRTSKACAILSGPHPSPGQGEESEPAYVFVGGASRVVALCDLRMSDESQNRAVQIYFPSGLSPSSHVSVSGLDLSRDREELLVSYESDQIYTFPIFPKSKLQSCSAMSRIEEIQDCIEASDSENERKTTLKPVRELATYGAHLNRFTFLKNARYAGPRDDYICTGSDSGHAWVYEKATGAVASFWMADNSTCNGVIPHPSLPLFVTYGIDSTAKLWRSTIPVDRDLDDSAVGRRRHARESMYEMSPTTRDWGEVEGVLKNLDVRDGGNAETDILPDHIPSTRILMRRGRLARSWTRETISINNGVPRIGNDLHNLHATLRENLYTCLRSLYEDDDVPVESDIDDLKRRVSAIRLRYQADRLGLNWRLSVPWAMTSGNTVVTDEDRLKDLPEDHVVDPADLVPDFPSDWVPYDPEISSEPFDFCNFFRVEDYFTFFADRYRYMNERSGFNEKTLLEISKKAEIKNDVILYDMEDGNDDDKKDSYGRKGPLDHELIDEISVDRSENNAVEVILLETMNILKDGGNRAMKAGNYNVAGRRYDKAIQYGTMLHTKSLSVNLDSWNPLIRTLVVSRLNMALLMIKPEFSELQVAERQAKLALKELYPFVDDTSLSKDTKDEIISLRSKAFFRMGSSQFAMGDYSNAINSFEESIECTAMLSDTDSKPDPLVVRRLAEAKREHVKRKKRQRKKFKIAFASTTSPLEASTPSPASSIASLEAHATPKPRSGDSKHVAVVSDTKPSEIKSANN